MRQTFKALIFALTFASAPALAVTEQQVQFAFHPSELTSASTRAALHDRLERFAAQQCDAGSPYAAMAELECKEELVEAIIQQIGNRQLASLAGVVLA